MEEMQNEFELAEKSKPKKSKKGRKLLWVFITVILMVLTFFGGTIYGAYFLLNGAGESMGFNTNRVMQKLSILEQCVNQFYYNDVKAEDLENGVYQGFMKALKDPYSEYYTAEDYRQLMEEDSGEYKGIGITVIKNTSNNYTEIVTVNKGDPAYNAGIKVGDFITKVNGQDTQEMTLQEVVGLIKTADDPVQITIFRETGEMEFSVSKSTITINTVEYSMQDNQIGLITVSQFLENTDEMFLKAVADLEKQGMKGLVIDLRDNGGGMLDTCINMVSRFIEKDKLIVYTETKDGKKTEYNSNSSDTLKVPVVLLVNGNTASASEIMTGCLKDYNLATVVGTNTFGKGIVQSIMPLSDGSALKLTVSAYYTPSGVNIHKKGIAPDETIEMTDEEWKKALEDPSTDKQMKRAFEIINESNK
ncbi:MAG: S41 family peptidase [Eubacteriales bacterium]|nr:S41 family peptidase [Eubacteriales bacterium]